MRIGSGEFTYEWVDNWGRIPDTDGGRANGRTHGVVVSKSGDVLVFNQAQPGVLRFDRDGRLKNAWGDRFGGAHGMSLVEDNGTEFLWLTDQDSAEVVKTTLDGKTVMTLSRPDTAAYRNGGRYVPTWVAVNETRAGGNGDIWVADGYGSNWVHRYSVAGAYVGAINGTEGPAGAFKCPHGIAFVQRGGTPELWIADRGNKRVQVYDPDGHFKRAFGSDQLNSPCGFVTRGELVYTPELHASVKVIDKNDRVVATLGANEPVVKIPGWPNHEKKLIEPGKFNSPHGMAVAPNGDLYVVEWIVGGRITKLARV